MMLQKISCGQYLAPFAGAPVGTGNVIAGFAQDSLLLATLSLHQPATQIVHTVRLPCPDAVSTALRALQPQSHRITKQHMIICKSTNPYIFTSLLHLQATDYRQNIIFNSSPYSEGFYWGVCLYHSH